MEKGDIVLVEATVFTSYEYGSQISDCETVFRVDAQNGKHLFKLKEVEPWYGLVCGYSFRYTGIRDSGSHYTDYTPSLGHLKAHKIWMIQPIDTDRWYKPYTCLEEDLSSVDD